MVHPNIIHPIGCYSEDEEQGPLIDFSMLYTQLEQYLAFNGMLKDAEEETNFRVVGNVVVHNDDQTSDHLVDELNRQNAEMNQQILEMSRAAAARWRYEQTKTKLPEERAST